MGHRFLTEPWLKEAKRALNASEDFHRALGDQSGAVLTIVTETPKGASAYLYYEFEHGALKRAAVGTDESIAPRNVDFTLTGTWDTFRRLHMGTLSVAGAYFQRKVRIGGDRARALRFAPAFLKYNEVVRRVDTAF
jgi:putative sterol carrier protein